MSLLRRLFRALRGPDARVDALEAQARAASVYARHVAMMRRCVDELHREALASERLLGNGSHVHADVQRHAYRTRADAIAEWKKQKAELAAMEATQARQEERFAQNKFALLSEGFAVEGIALVPPDTDAAEYEADRLIASFELETDLSGRPMPGLH